MNFVLKIPVYLPVNATQGEDIVRLFAMVGTKSFQPDDMNYNDTSYVKRYYWNIKIRQIDCSDPEEELKG